MSSEKTENICIGIAAHVDSGKTTLSEALLFACGAIKDRGRVDHGNAFLDTDSIEKDRGITIFSKQAVLKLPGKTFYLIDTPGHSDFSAETERALRILDYVILVVSASEGVQSHTLTLWKLIEHYHIPAFVFVNKMDLPNPGRKAIVEELSAKLGQGFVDFGAKDEELFESCALEDQELLDEYLAGGKLSRESLTGSILRRAVKPCFFGSALKYEGCDDFLKAVARYTVQPDYPPEFGARVFKITEDEKGRRLTHLKITGGSLKIRDTLEFSGGECKVGEIRVYSGAKSSFVSEAPAGSVCAVAGPSDSFAGEGLGFERAGRDMVSEAVLSYSVILPEGCDVTSALRIFKRLEDEEPSLRVEFDSRSGRINLRIMGEIQLEVVKRILLERYGLDVSFDRGSVIYMETIKEPVEGMGHYEPLKHYAEVHLLIEPAAPGSGISVGSLVSTDKLERNWQRLIITHILEKTHLGVLTGSPLTDVRISILAGRAHVKHTEGGDFRQATYRAIRQGLMQAESVLLEPWYDYSVILPVSMSGKVMNDIQLMGGTASITQGVEDTAIVSGSVPAAAFRDYRPALVASSHGLARISASYRGYRPCADPEKVIAEIAYDPEADTENSADSIFCSHGAGELVKWDKVAEHMHIPPVKERSESDGSLPRYSRPVDADSDKELLAIFEKTYGKIRETEIHRAFAKKPEGGAKPVTSLRKQAVPENKPCVIFVDGYNMIFAWEELKKLAEDSGLARARSVLADRLVNYQAFRDHDVFLVFDAYKVKGAIEKEEEDGGLVIVYTREGETADQYIERRVAALKKSGELKDREVLVASSDRLEQFSVFSHGAGRITALEFLAELEEAERRIREIIRNQ